MVARAKYLRENLVKLDGSLATDDELEKTIDEESSQAAVNHNTSQTSVQSKQATDVSTKPPKTARQSEEAPPTKTSKTSKPKKEKNDVKIAAVEEPEKINETIVVVEEVLSNRPPTPPKPKTQLPPLDLTPFIRFLFCSLKIFNEYFKLNAN